MLRSDFNIDQIVVTLGLPTSARVVGRGSMYGRRRYHGERSSAKPKCTQT
ncbi:MAG: hypothetical protein QG670_1816 [Thermoproteota archaeon]|nr:hypothetical protein [Thermoproteota archaeon]